MCEGGSQIESSIDLGLCFICFLQKVILHPDEMKLLKNQLKKFPIGN